MPPSVDDRPVESGETFDSEPTTGGALQTTGVTQPPAVRKPPSLALSPDAMPDEWHHNFDLSTEAGKAAMLNAANVSDWIPADGKPFPMKAVHYLCCPGQYVDRKTGEVVECTNCIFVGHDGKTARFQSSWNLRKLNALLHMYSPERWKEGIDIECRIGHSRQGGQPYGYFVIIPKKDE